ncbi:Nitroreductase [Candidatus Syntrophocurvum alkaliphilum]|uniref:Nitroreductase n=1 Tax=Candidatus Syntrophocurvum alkaliphilum TaxID=2293317 RepID=A0A6I6D7V9_9FIRM|nr:nitroreductase family protein [Candidatus Syntrophocurvum alkaliphilum]QGT98707.1 Nitroreductase [Candidatus Syntrophocurvum alkaliphilum]
MNTLECIKTRRSIRRFTDQPIPDDVLTQLLEAIRWSPSWANTQCWEVVIVKEQASKEKLVELLTENNPATKGVLQAPLVVVVCGKKGISGFKRGEAQTVQGDNWYLFDAGIACQNLCLAAHSLGLGTVNIGSFDHKKTGEFLGLPEDIEPVEIIPVGYPAKEGKAPPRKELSEFVHVEKFGQTYK